MPGPALEISRVLARVLAPGGVLALTTVDLCGRSAEFICGLQLLRRHVLLNAASVLQVARHLQRPQAEHVRRAPRSQNWRQRPDAG